MVVVLRVSLPAWLCIFTAIGSPNGCSSNGSILRLWSLRYAPVLRFQIVAASFAASAQKEWSRGESLIMHLMVVVMLPLCRSILPLWLGVCGAEKVWLMPLEEQLLVK